MPDLEREDIGPGGEPIHGHVHREVERTVLVSGGDYALFLAVDARVRAVDDLGRREAGREHPGLTLVFVREGRDLLRSLEYPARRGPDREEVGD